jgi:chemotaxis protein MotB
MTIKSDVQGVTVAFESTVFFDTLNAEIRPEGKLVLDRLIETLKKNQVEQSKQYKVMVEGHTDSRPVNSREFPSNWELGGARASRVVRLFIEHQFSPDHLTAMSFADTRPQAPSKTSSGEWDEAALSKNRRVVIRILEPEVESIALNPEAKPSEEPQATAGAPGSEPQREPAAANPLDTYGPLPIAEPSAGPQ